MVQWLRLPASNARSVVQSLAKELRSHMLWGQKLKIHKVHNSKKKITLPCDRREQEWHPRNSYWDRTNEEEWGLGLEWQLVEDGGSQGGILLYREVLCFVYREDSGGKTTRYFSKIASFREPMLSNCGIQKSKGLFPTLLPEITEITAPLGFADLVSCGSLSPS